MPIKVEDQHKIRIAKWGANKLFGDPDKRKNEMNDEQLIKLFDRVWNVTLEHAVLSADVCDANEAYERISAKERNFFDFEQEHRQFRLKDLNVEFIAQLESLADDEQSLTQLWRISSTDINPKTLYVTFETVEERLRFKEIANSLGWHDDNLGLNLILDFMAKVSKKT
jgi:hypothetical protein